MFEDMTEELSDIMGNLKAVEGHGFCQIVLTLCSTFNLASGHDIPHIGAALISQLLEGMVLAGHITQEKADKYVATTRMLLKKQEEYNKGKSNGPPTA